MMLDSQVYNSSYPRLATGQDPIGYKIIEDLTTQDLVYSAGMPLLKRFIAKQLFPFETPPPDYLYNAIGFYLKSAQFDADMLGLDQGVGHTAVLLKDRVSIDLTVLGAPQIIDSPDLKKRMSGFDPDSELPQLGLILPENKGCLYLPDRDGYIYFKGTQSIDQWRTYNTSIEKDTPWDLVCGALDDALNVYAEYQASSVQTETKLPPLITPILTDEPITESASQREKRVRVVKRKRTDHTTKPKNDGLVYVPSVQEKPNEELGKIIARTKSLAINVWRTTLKLDRHKNALRRLLRLFRSKRKDLKISIENHKILLKKAEAQEANPNTYQYFLNEIESQKKLITEKEQALIELKLVNKKPYKRIRKLRNDCIIKIRDLSLQQQENRVAYFEKIAELGLKISNADINPDISYDYWKSYYRCVAFEKAAEEIAIRRYDKKLENTKNEQRLAEWESRIIRQIESGFYMASVIKPGEKSKFEIDSQELERRERKLAASAISLRNTELRYNVIMNRFYQVSDILMKAGVKPNELLPADKSKWLEERAVIYAREKINEDFQMARSTLEPKPLMARKAAKIVMAGHVPNKEPHQLTYSTANQVLAEAITEKELEARRIHNHKIRRAIELLPVV